MTAYMHMGHDTENLVGERDLEDFSGLILSPVNRTPDYLKSSINTLRSKGEFDIVLDPQLYFPRGQRGHINKQPYFPSDFESADMSSFPWWQSVVEKLAEFATQLGINAVTSPVIHPRVWDDGYFSTCVKASNELKNLLSSSKIRVLTTVLVNNGQIADEQFVLRVASLSTIRETDGFYVVLSGDIEPRREIADPEELFGIMSLIGELRRTEKPVIISHCSSDMLLYKAAGATHCATGKFFNLRRFTKSRYNEPSQGGGQLPYWFEHSLLAFIREADVLRLKRDGFENLVGTMASNNHWAEQILENFNSVSRKPWIALGWRQYLSWFAKTAKMLDANERIDIVQRWLKEAEDNWIKLEDIPLLMEEPRNNGTWLRPWRQSLIKYARSR